MILFNILKNFGRSRVRYFGKTATSQQNLIEKKIANYIHGKKLSQTRVKINHDLKRFYSDGANYPQIRLPPLTDDPVHLMPNLFKAIPSSFYLHTVIRSRLDEEFDMPDFIEGTKQAVEFVSTALGNEDYDSLTGLVTNEVINKLRTKISTLSQEQKNLIPVQKNEIYGFFPYSIRAFNENEDGNNRTFAEIIMVYFSLRGLKEMQEQSKMPPLQMGFMPEYQDKMYVCNYKFRRDYTNGNTEPWIVTMCNHMMLIAA